MISWLNYAILGVVQGLTEFLPVSSSGHLVVFQAVLGVDAHAESGAAVEVAMHAGTLFSVLLFLRADLIRLCRAVLTPARSMDPEERRSTRTLFFALVVASVPAAVVGLAFGDQIEAMFGDPRVAGVGFLVTGALLLLSKRIVSAQATKTTPTPTPPGTKTLSMGGAFVVGLFQMMAMVPGVSRSGSTIFAGMFRGLSSADAGRFSFLMAIPVIAGATVLKADEILGTPADQRSALLIGVGFAFVSGLLALKILSLVLRRGSLHRFAYYVIPLGVVVLAFA